MKFSKIDDKLSIYQKKDVYIWGASSAGRIIFNLLSKFKVNIIAFIDSDSQKWNTKFCSHKIISPKELNNCDKEKIIVQIGSTHEKEISIVLNDMGIDNIWYTEARERLSSISKKILCENEYICKEFAKYRQAEQYIGAREKFLNYAIQCNYYSDEIIVIYMAGKTGDNTLMTTMDYYNKNYMNVWHTWPDFRGLGKLYEECNKKIITAVREPISQNLSWMFQNISTRYFDYDECLKDGGDVQALFEIIINSFKEKEQNIKKAGYQKKFWEYLYDCGFNIPLIQKFFDNDFLNRFGINIYDFPFDKNKGFSIIRLEKCEVFIYQLEKLNDIQEYLFNFLDIENAQLVNSNMAKERWYYPYYKEAQKNIKLSKEYFNDCFNSKYIHHFYSEEDIRKFRAIWGNHIQN